MANEVFANGREISCKKADGKSICAFPDVCFTPPENPATPPGVPVPYPNTGMAKDTTSGTKKVKITDKEVILKNKSHFKKSYGDEAGSATKKGIVTSTNRGKIYFTTWSMDVKFEGLNVVRHLDLTTHNHRSLPSNTLPWTYNDRIAMAKGLKSCDKEMAEVEKHCPKDKNKQVKCPGHKKVFVGPTTRMKDRSLKGLEDYTVRIRKGESKVTKCHRALRCVLVPYEKNGKRMCCPPQTPEHLVPKACMKGVPGYISDDAPCICAEGGKSDATHGLIGDERNKLLDKKGIKLNDPCEFATLLDVGAQAAHNIFSHCSKKCIRAQLKRGAHKGISPTQPVVNKQENVRKDNSALRARLQRASR
ncbi:MAG: hypothetical protein B6D72_00950 [gamma proteobacterium symbiont of Ctena orbiculata]|uniref:DUF4150 domain-containing protein n=1 Tax=Candidatus Thiodiazotropha taylori TaxID=2792791 RepID=A0A944MGU2_9GAMM|nr:DUF4150 domain-containing protein [Candidatus Thiodiazotropha taylori]PUB77925.1 MAG: hypothetical protein DBP01_18450 [gamma proteobacterium symbiont of Ctena orbiculata]MBT2990720.1 DUF4150 domain-containing protein [Candidatus Thiodiazotropha taylori]MBT2996657.1 DUF4150 domain-containing protein [Candidatus Thiodiazotropha taylori]MBT3000697.1 DUF4150 domain-containing protein [Candidatus Thiodiazotropha taylori]